MTFRWQYKKLNRDNDIFLYFQFYSSWKSIRNNFYDVCVEMSGKYKKYLIHMSIPANFQNNYIKLSGFGFNKTRLLHWGSDEKNYLPIKSFSISKILSQFFWPISQNSFNVFGFITQYIVLVTIFFMKRSRFNDRII